MDYNGGSIVAMTGKDCVAIASDKRFGQQFLTISTDVIKIYPVTERVYIGLPGLATDAQTIADRVRFKVNMYKLTEEREIEPRTLARMVASTLYEKRFSPYYNEPIIAGIDKNNKPYIAGMDLLGCINSTKDFVISGTAAESLFGMCESLWEPDLEPEDLFETISQAMLSSCDRDTISGWGAVVNIITPERVIIRNLKARMD